jgi:hypothetical protein
MVLFWYFGLYMVSIGKAVVQNDMALAYIKAYKYKIHKAPEVRWFVYMHAHVFYTKSLSRWFNGLLDILTCNIMRFRRWISRTTM